MYYDNYSYEERREIVDKLYGLLQDGMTFTLTKKDVAEGDHHLIFSAYKKHTVTIHMDRVPWWVDYDHDEMMRLEECPVSFYETLILNIEKGNYTIKE